MSWSHGNHLLNDFNRPEIAAATTHHMTARLNAQQLQLMR
jgi:hypothetical protein